MQLDQFDRGRLSQTEDVYGQLRAALLSGRYLPDQKLKISELCGEVRGSLGAVREALSRLLAEGLVVSESYKGYSVAPVSRTDLISLTNARIEIERLCLTSSLANGDLEWEGRLVALLHQMNRHSPLENMGNTIEDWSRLHTAFHDALVSACDNPWLLRMHRTLHEQSERYRRFVLQFNAGLEESSRRQVARDTTTEHQDLLEAALARDIDRMNTLMAAHVQRTTYLLLAGLETDDLAQPAPGVSMEQRPSRAS